MSESCTEESDTGAPPAVPFATACRYWLELGFVSFGGPAGQISMMHGELVERRHWISERRFLHALNFTMVLPGPEAQQLATYMGWLMHGTLGGIVAGSLFVLPSLLLLVLLAWGYMAWGDLPAVAAVLYGVKPAVTAIVVHAAVRIGKRALRHPLLLAIAVTAFLLLFLFEAPFPLIIAAAALAGWVGSRFVPAAFAHTGAHGPTVAVEGRAIIDDDTPLPAHARFRWSVAALYLAVGLGLWLLVEGALAATFGWRGPLTQLGWFFTKAALVTFGGAYAVLPYVVQGAVENHGWITAEQMMDGLALGETTPGPLIMVNTFVGFVAGWNEAVFGAGELAAAGIAGALVVTFVTFLPSFVFVLVGAPAVEATRHQLGFSAPLAGITAAVVGVIVNLALFFAWHVLWPRADAGTPFAGGFEWPSLVLMLAALAGLWRYRLGVVPVLLACAAAGLAWHALRALA
jgi:chromate transporter